MRTYRLIILLFLGACKASTSTGPVGEYSEDLAIHRPIMQSTQQDSLPDEVAKKEDYRALEGHIKNELDSISRVIKEKKVGIPLEGILSLGEISSYGDGYLEFFNKTIVVGAFRNHDR